MLPRAWDIERSVPLGRWLGANTHGLPCPGFFAGLLPADRVFALLIDLLPDMLGSFVSIATAQMPSPPKPRSGSIASGAGSQTGLNGANRNSASDALFAAKVQSNHRRQY